ncbi:MAG: hypothetical protein KDD89_05760 [Anaerolineales bacterium]|nr:hypothetical protein [Anaerolineales bacterium]
MDEFVVIVENNADAQTAIQLAERVLIDQIDWLEQDILVHLYQWSGLLEQTDCSCWKDIGRIFDQYERSGWKRPKPIGHYKGNPLKADGTVAVKILHLVRHLQKDRQIRAVLFIRDIDKQPQRKLGLEQARDKYLGRQLSSSLTIVIGTANRMREAWVLNGFFAADEDEENRLAEIIGHIHFDPCVNSHRLHADSYDEPERQRNPKIVLEQLTNGNYEREQRCWTETDLSRLRERGTQTGLTAYLQEVEDRLVPILVRGE